MNRRLRFILFVPVFCIAGFEIGKAQLPTNQNRDPTLNPIGSSEIRDTTPTEVLPLDTPTAMTYVLVVDPDELHAFTDTFTWSDNKHHPLPFYRSHLGNYGSPSRSLTPSIDLKKGFFTGWDQYDPYFISADSFRYYNQNVPVAKIKYSQSSQEDTYLTLDFGRSFTKGVSLSFTYDRINQIGEFAHHHQKNTALGLGLWHNTPSGKYDAFYNYIANDAVGEENGGISAPELIGDTLTPNINVPVFINEGITTHKFKLFTTKHILHLISDTSDIGIDLWLQGHIGSGLYKYVDEGASEDTLTSKYYMSFLLDDRGIRQFTFQQEYQVAAGLALPWRAARSTIETSLQFRTIHLQQEPFDTRINELFWNASGKFNWIDPLELKGTMAVGLGQAGGAFIFKADASLNTSILGKLKGYWSVSTRKPYMIESALFVNQQAVYNADFQNPFTTEFGVGWDWEKQALDAGISWLIFDNYIFFDTSKTPKQIEQSFSLRRFFAAKDFDFKWIGIRGHFIWQPDAREELAIPDLIYTAGLYGRFKIFKRKVTLMPGIDITYHDGFREVGFFPVTGRYHLKRDQLIPDYFRVDAAIGVHINFLKAFIRMDDLAGLWEDRVLYQADYYPHYPAYLRIGLEAGFFN